MNNFINSLIQIPWSRINALGKMRFSKSSYYFLVLIPIIVKTTEKLKDPLELVLNGQIYPITLSLPFSWYMFYFGAIAIALGSIIYQLFCPKIIKDFKNYGEFKQAGASDSYLFNISKKYLKEEETLTGIIQETPYLRDEKIEEGQGVSGFLEKKVKTEFRHNLKYEEDRKNTFNDVYNKVEHYLQPIIFISFISYCIGFAAFLYVIIQNIAFVVSRLF